MALGLTQPLTEMSASNISWEGGKGGRCVWLTTLPPSCVDCLQIWEPQPAVQACNINMNNKYVILYEFYSKSVG